MEPFSNKCWKCKELSVIRAKIPYTLVFGYSDELHTIEIPVLIVPRCSKCNEIVFDQWANSQIDGAIRNKLRLLQPEEIQQVLDKHGCEVVAEKLSVAVNYLKSCAEGDRFTIREVDNGLRRFKEQNGK
jgi:phage FluMu protein Com